MGSLTAWLPLSSSTTNVDAAIAQVNSGAVNTSGGNPGTGRCRRHGTLCRRAPRHLLDRAAKARTATVDMVVAKSGRTTGLTCASISAVNLNCPSGLLQGLRREHSRI